MPTPRFRCERAIAHLGNCEITLGFKIYCGKHLLVEAWASRDGQVFTMIWTMDPRAHVHTFYGEYEAATREAERIARDFLSGFDFEDKEFAAFMAGLGPSRWDR